MPKTGSMNTLGKIVERPVERIKEKHEEKRNHKKFHEEKERIEKDVISKIDDHNSQYCKRNITQEDIDWHIWTREYEVEGMRKIKQLAQKYGIEDYEIKLTYLY